jgi:hypothetical protein
MKKSSKRTSTKAKSKKGQEPLGCVVLGGLNKYGDNLGFSVRHHLGVGLDFVDAETKEQLLDALAKKRPPLCILEYVIGVAATAKSATTLMAEGMPREIAETLDGHSWRLCPLTQLWTKLTLQALTRASSSSATTRDTTSLRLTSKDTRSIRQ